jgi:hypothetical protein
MKKMYESNFIKYGIFLLGLFIVLYLFHFIHVKIEWNGFGYEGFTDDQGGDYQDYNYSSDNVSQNYGEERNKEYTGNNVEIIDEDKWKGVKYVPKRKTKKEKELAKYRMDMLKKKKQSMKKVEKKPEKKPQTGKKTVKKGGTTGTKKVKEKYTEIHNPRENIDYDTDETTEESRRNQSNFPTDAELRDYEDRTDKDNIKENYCEDDDEDDDESDDEEEEEERVKKVKKVEKKKGKLAPLAMSMNLQPNCRPRSYQLGRYGWSYLPPTTWSVPQMRPPTCLPSGKSCRVCPTASTEWSSKYGEFLTREEWDTNQENIEMVSDKNYWYPGYISADPVA